MLRKIESVTIIWLDDDGWQFVKKVKGREIIVSDRKSQGIFPHGIQIQFSGERTVYVLAVEPDEYIESEKAYKYIRGGEEFIIAFGEEVAKRQKLLIEGIDVEI